MDLVNKSLEFIFHQLDRRGYIERADLDFYTWLFWLCWPFILVTVILPLVLISLIYTSACLVHIYGLRRHFNMGQFASLDRIYKARMALALLWECHGWVWHGYEVIGMENVPETGGALLVYYHGAVPVDNYYLNSRFFIHRKRSLWTIAATFLFKIPGLSLLLKVIQATPGTVKEIAMLLGAGEIVTVAPGGIRESQFSSEHYELVWNNHIGFAKAACLGKAPIVPIFTQNIREAWRTAPFLRGLFRWIYEKTRLPLLPVYGGFPVKLRTYIGEPIAYDESASPEEVAKRTANAIRALIKKHQRLPGSLVGALADRVRRPRHQRA